MLDLFPNTTTTELANWKRRGQLGLCGGLMGSGFFLGGLNKKACGTWEFCSRPLIVKTAILTTPPIYQLLYSHIYTQPRF